MQREAVRIPGRGGVEPLPAFGLASLAGAQARPARCGREERTVRLLLAGKTGSHRTVGANGSPGRQSHFIKKELLTLEEHLNG